MVFFYLFHTWTLSSVFVLKSYCRYILEMNARASTILVCKMLYYMCSSSCMCVSVLTINECVASSSSILTNQHHIFAYTCKITHLSHTSGVCKYSQRTCSAGFRRCFLFFEVTTSKSVVDSDFAHPAFVRSSIRPRAKGCARSSRVRYACCIRTGADFLRVVSLPPTERSECSVCACVSSVPACNTHYYSRTHKHTHRTYMVVSAFEA